jgi:hypothetical protein
VAGCPFFGSFLWASKEMNNPNISKTRAADQVAIREKKDRLISTH